MDVMATGVHDAFVAGFVRNIVLFTDGQGIHICTEGDYAFVRVFSFYQPDYSCFRHYFKRDPKFLQPALDEF